MVSAVFHTPLQASMDAKADAAANLKAAKAAVAEPLKPVPPPRPGFDWNGLLLKVLPPLIGVALLIGI